MTQEQFAFRIEIWRGGQRIGATSASLAACEEDALFHGVVSGAFPNDGNVPELHVTPDWHATERSAVTGLFLRVGALPERRYDRSVFDPQARAFGATLVAAGRLAAGEKTEWRLEARTAPAGVAPSRGRTHRAPYPLTAAELSDVAPGGREICVDAWLLRRLHRVAGRPAPAERAGLLAGKLLHDPQRGALRVHVTDVVDLEARPGGASETRFHFDPASLLAAQRALRERGDGVVSTGWLHTHPPCRDCYARSDCRVDWVFFSADDLDVHAAAFPRPYAVGLVAGKVAALPAGRPGFRLYGWQSGRVVPLPFRVTGAGAEGWDAALETFGAEEGSVSATSTASESIDPIASPLED